MASSDLTSPWSHLTLNEESFNVGLMNLHGSLGFALDIGSTLTKLVFIQPTERTVTEGYNPYHHDYVIRLMTFQNENIAAALDCVKETVIKGQDIHYPKFLKIGTGRGLQKYCQKIRDKFGFELAQKDDVTSLAHGIHYGVKRFGEKFFQPLTTSPAQKPQNVEVEEEEPDPEDMEGVEEQIEKHCEKYLPCLLVCQGSVTQLAIVNGNGEPDMLAGSSLGGLLFHTLGKLLTGCQSYAELLRLAENGDASNVNINSESRPAGEPGSPSVPPTILYPFAKVLEDGAGGPKKEDLACGMMEMVCRETSRQALTIASLKKVKGIYYCGGFCQSNSFLEECIKKQSRESLMVSDHEPTSRLCRFSGYLRVIGALMIEVDMMEFLMICPCPCDPPPELVRIPELL